MRNDDSIQQATNHEDADDTVNVCRTHLDALQNLTYLISLEAENPREVRVHLRIMEWHLQILQDTLLHRWQ